MNAQFVSPSTLAESIHEIVLTEFQRTRTPHSLSRVGDAILDRYKLTFKELYPQSSLKEFILDYLADRIELTTDPDHPLLVSAHPKGADVDAVVPIAREEATPKHRPAPEFDKAVWAAFAIPIERDRRRYLSKEMPFRFVDLSEGDPAPPNTFEIPRVLIVSRDIPRHDPVRKTNVLRNIQRWIEEEQLEERLFLQKKEGLGEQADLQKAGVDALLRFIEVVPESERARISIPLDILKKIIRSG